MEQKLGTAIRIDTLIDLLNKAKAHGADEVMFGCEVSVRRPDDDDGTVTPCVYISRAERSYIWKRNRQLC